MTQQKQAKSESALYIHGWGMHSDFWRPLQQAMPFAGETVTLDLGFMGVPYIPQPLPQTDYIIAHSLGGLWALHHQLTPRKGIIFINSFYDFTDFTDATTLTIMQTALQKDASAQMQRFLKRADCLNCLPSAPQNIHWHQGNLHDGLQALKTWSGEKHLNALKNSDVKILTLAGAKDRICPLSIIKTHWIDFPIITNENAGHALPYSHTDWCAQTITNWMHA